MVNGNEAKNEEAMIKDVGRYKPQPPKVVPVATNDIPTIDSSTLQKEKKNVGENEQKKYVPQISLIDEPSKSEPSSTSTTTISSKEIPKTYKPTTPPPTNSEADGKKEEEAKRPPFHQQFPNFFSRFKEIFGDNPISFF